ncbi:MAG: superoxide dismutase family protein [Clostridia bacterium]|jgi:Cu-Zn family superoxide dismutase|nr:superoxide dismutase family protein [Clostridia bacterium]
MHINIFNSAKAHIKGGKKFPKINGLVTFKETKHGILITAKINGLPQSNNKCTGRFFGLHIHDGNSCTGNSNDEFANAKSHLSLTDCPHPFHSGDLPPLIENNGHAYMSVLINKFKIKDIIGKVIIIHDSPDDFTTQPSGNSGTKIACGQIK